MELPGIKFLPTDSEILSYLRSIIHGEIQFLLTADGSGITLIADMIHNYNVYETEPWNLPRNHPSACSAGTEAYYFTRRQKKHCRGASMRATRRAGAGTWRASRMEKAVVSEDDGVTVVGHSTLLCYISDGTKTSCGWVMDEYRLVPDPRFPEYENWSICRVRRNATTEKRMRKGQICG